MVSAGGYECVWCACIPPPPPHRPSHGAGTVPCAEFGIGGADHAAPAEPCHKAFGAARATPSVHCLSPRPA